MNRACFELEGNSCTYLTSRETHTLQGKPHLRLFPFPLFSNQSGPVSLTLYAPLLLSVKLKKFNSRWIYNLFHSGLVLAKHGMMRSCCWQHEDGLQAQKFNGIECWQSLDAIMSLDHFAVKGLLQLSEERAAPVSPVRECSPFSCPSSGPHSALGFLFIIFPQSMFWESLVVPQILRRMGTNEIHRS